MACWGVLWAWTSGFVPFFSWAGVWSQAVQRAHQLVWSFMYSVNFSVPPTKISPSFPDTQLFPFLKPPCLKASLSLWSLMLDHMNVECTASHKAEGLGVTFPWLLLNLPMMFGELDWAFCPDSFLGPDLTGSWLPSVEQRKTWGHRCVPKVRIKNL